MRPARPGLTYVQMFWERMIFVSTKARPLSWQEGFRLSDFEGQIRQRVL